MNNKRMRAILAKLIILTVLLILGAVGLHLYCVVNPLDRVSVRTSQLPDDTVFLSFVSESNGVVQNMDWYIRSEIIIPFTISPVRCIWSDWEDKKPPKVIDWDAHVKWRRAHRYGVVTMDGGGDWRVTWFSADEVSITNCWFLPGSTNAYFDLNKGKTTPLPEEQLKKLRLHEYPFLDEKLNKMNKERKAE